MIYNIQKQLANITLSQIEDVLKQKLGIEYDKILLSKNDFFRENYLFGRLDYEVVERKRYNAKFPLSVEAMSIFETFEGGSKKHGNLAVFPCDKFVKYIRNKINVAINQEIIALPFETIRERINPTQPYYFFPNSTYKETCSTCKSRCEIKCSDCNGKGEVWCDRCKGKGDLVCPDCKGNGFVKCGSKFLSTGCGGSGRGTDGKRCQECRGRGEIRCTKKGCVNGVVDCEKCQGRRKIDCKKCNGKGQVDCPECNAHGYFVNIDFVETLVKLGSFQKFLPLPNNQYISETTLLKHINSKIDTTLVYQNINDKIFENYDVTSKKFIADFEKELSIFKNKMPLITEEKIYYQIIPYIRIDYKHILTGREEQLSIVNFFDNPEIIFHNNPEKVKQNAKNILKTVNGIIGKILKTKKYLATEDKYKEIVLLIYLSKADGLVKKEEKEFFIREINGIETFTNYQKKTLFNFLGMKELPNLTEKQTTFSSQEKALEVFQNLTKIANIDGNICQKEKELLDKIYEFINKN